MSFARKQGGLRSAVFSALGDNAFVNDATVPIRARLRERDEQLSFGESRFSSAFVRIEVPASVGIKTGDEIAMLSRRFKVNSDPLLVRSGVHSCPCEEIE